MVIWVEKNKVIKKTQGLWQEFKAFAVKGNVVDLAIAVVVGGAFTGVVNALVADVITPILGIITGNVDFKTLSVDIKPGLTMPYGLFLQALFNFLLVSVSIFVVFKLITSARDRLFVQEQKDPPPPAQKPEDVRLLEEIRDLLKQGVPEKPKA
ncbi:MAG TPA: large conductance mechanosensitive channel protein MscL [Candidatus Paceibacterota bacterium]|nr:large conductance mechanosensitive channel protein MscL [Candidatus Paceibacterota bacterium]